MEQAELRSILESHQLWLKGEPSGKQAVFQNLPLDDDDGSDFGGFSLNRVIWINCRFGKPAFEDPIWYGKDGLNGSSFTGCVFPMVSEDIDEWDQITSIDGVIERVDFSNSEFNNCVFASSSFLDCKFTNSVFNNCEMSGSVLSAVGSDPAFDNVRLVDCNLRGATIMSSSVFQSADLSECDCSKLSMDMVGMDGSNFTKANLYGASMDLCSLNNSNFDEAKLRNACMRNASLNNSTFIKANMRDAFLPGSHLNGAILRGADLSDGNLNRADLRGADLSDADLSRCDLTYADLRGAIMNGAILDGAILTNAYLDNPGLTGVVTD